MSGPKLARNLSLETPHRVADGQGGYTEHWEKLGNLWGQVKAGSGRDVSGLDAEMSRVPLRITVRAAPQGAPSRPKVGQRFRDGMRVFEIVAVTESRDGSKYLDCNALEELAT
ncbi:head-tail adaptor protein [Palleronia sp. LCG004]|uniref:head-tail adaptor protein n=1 Tax=Palleronia sp. LCG004 TaxID=3079304 RepID=UPI002943771B|nr:head-tail adaptor protein [Palleronia sp. LCG004]WOI55013.1 head-tail adaptor protein [Palleronia sp. LCG004]